MKINYSNTMSRKMTATVWQNDTPHTIRVGETLDLKVQRGDKITYKVGRFNAIHTIDYQSPDAQFEIQINRSLQNAYFVVMFAMVVFLWFNRNFSQTILIAAVILGLAGYEALVYFVGYMAKPIH
ncbi:hypothetical protein [Lacticaseibacillus paracasei]|uniref:Uncharacterized protein n=2 Tax=Lacticaseibacillus paracasei TaxID=1597 RepID=A0AAP9KVR2_LACPA|nr:hypothetical protein [Lacticaseibacillus paracasei]EPC84247.1 hypothetical protein Lpp124_14632 [Lacticaseibacillus paracasei subsp. paracasei CNCM I-4649]EPC97233.1 hypothetical protein Lpp27_09123 [Lacticaseibacillus paracasei subsp. paracasei CNCM I-4648]NMN61286.1 hypothetical protein [Lacticaseibacillus casei]NMN65933.1 hypothetical protein [Lacticaseibacillus casei CRF28]PTS49802.1 hypothetical protein DBQ62_09415 [Lactobacillus sp. DS9_6]PTS61023.1 hypothetical protein DBQ68_10300 [